MVENTAVPPVNVSPPVLSGEPNVGAVLTVSSGVWEGTPTRFDYFWMRNNNWIGGSIASSNYRLVAADEGAMMSVEVQAWNGSGAVIVTSNSVGPVRSDAASQPPVNTQSPQVYTNPSTNGPYVGSYIYSSYGSWMNPVTSYEFAWLRDGELIAATTPNYYYLLTAADAGAMISSVVIAKNVAGDSQAPSRNALGPVAPGAPTGPPVNTVPPVVSGAPQIGSDLTVSNGTWMNSPGSYWYVWSREPGGVIADARNQTYTVRAADEGAMVIGFVGAENALGEAGAFSSNRIGPITAKRR